MKRKVLPQWLREGLEKLEREKMKKLEREAREAATSEHSSRPSWRDELDEEEGGERMLKTESEQTTLRSYRQHIRPHTASPSQVSPCANSTLHVLVYMYICEQRSCLLLEM